jgi:hypothetical protein
MANPDWTDPLDWEEPDTKESPMQNLSQIDAAPRELSDRLNALHAKLHSIIGNDELSTMRQGIAIALAVSLELDMIGEAATALRDLDKAAR